MEKRKMQILGNIIFGILCVGLYYLNPYIAWYTMEGDKTDILMGEIFGVIPLGLFIISIIYGIIYKKLLQPLCIAYLLGCPSIFFPFIGGNTILEIILTLIYLGVFIFLTVGSGTLLGIFIRCKGQ